jgi:hypothetical protein
VCKIAFQRRHEYRCDHPRGHDRQARPPYFVRGSFLESFDEKQDAGLAAEESDDVQQVHNILKLDCQSDVDARTSDVGSSTSSTLTKALGDTRLIFLPSPNGTTVHTSAVSIIQRTCR